MTKEINAKSIARSAERLEEFEKGHQEAFPAMKPVWFLFLKRESSILLRRAVRAWLRLRLGK